MLGTYQVRISACLPAILTIRGFPQFFQANPCQVASEVNISSINKTRTVDSRLGKDSSYALHLYNRYNIGTGGN